MPYKFIEHESDIGIRAWADNLEEAFAEGAKALFSIMFDIRKVEASIPVDIECEAPDIPTLFVEWLNKLLARADISRMALSDFKIFSVVFSDNGYKLKATAFGEIINADKHYFRIEVKAATYYGLKHEVSNGVHYLQCVVDV